MKRIAALALAAVLAGCGQLQMAPAGEIPLAADLQRPKPPFKREGAWVPLRLSKESFRFAEERLRNVKLGMSRNDFFWVMKIGPNIGFGVPAELPAAEGWFSDLSRTNRVNGAEIEEYPFGYYEHFRLRERFAVVLRNGVVVRIRQSAWPRAGGTPRLPSAIADYARSIEEETQRLKEFYHKRLQTQEAFKRILPQLRRIRPGWTSAEVRLVLGGSIYNLQNGPVYVQEGLLWDEGFTEDNSGTSQVVVMPFGYRGPDGRAYTSVIIRAEGGVVNSVYWKDDDGSKQTMGASKPAVRQAKALK